jgi:glycosyltransferase involved in cell wall biosynthesis
MRGEYINNFAYPKKWSAEILLNYLKNWDKRVSFGVTHFISISENVRNRIKQAYNRDSVVIYPPIDCNRFTISGDDDGYDLIVSALVPYKRIDIAVEAFNTLGRKLMIVGNGPELPRLKGMASANILFIDKADDSEVVEYMRKCKALIFPGEEDFGIVPLEAQACGKPVIAFGKGGVLETVVPDETGIFFHRQTSKALVEAVLSFEKNRGRFVSPKSRANALRFDRPIYQRSMQRYIQSVID